MMYPLPSLVIFLFPMITILQRNGENSEDLGEVRATDVGPWISELLFGGEPTNRVIQLETTTFHGCINRK